MAASREEIERLEEAYRRARRRIFGHALFLGVGCAVAILVRRNIKLGPAFVFMALIAALVLFAGDIIRLFYYRNELIRLRSAG